MKHRKQYTAVIVALLATFLLSSLLLFPPGSAGPLTQSLDALASSLKAPGFELAPNDQLTGGPIVPINFHLRWGDTLEEVLSRAGIPNQTIAEIISAIRPVFDLRRFRAGTTLALHLTPFGQLHALAYPINPDQTLTVRYDPSGYSAEIIETPSTTQTIALCGTLHGSLFESIARLGENPELAVRIAEIFAWDIDFYTDPQPGDQFCFVVEKKIYLNGQPPTYGRILAARYVNTGTTYEGYLFADESGEPQYYAPNGKSLRAAFLRSPLKFDARISSGFTYRRFHPILKTYRPHLGIDYAAPTGTPVQAIASGRVIFAGYAGGAGNMVKIEHANGYETRYLHLSRIYVRRGQRVHQGQVIGRVGATGLATGPHLDFRILKHGRYLNFLSLRPPRASNLPADRMPEFRELVSTYSAMFNAASTTPATLLASDSTSTTPAD